MPIAPSRPHPGPYLRMSPSGFIGAVMSVWAATSAVALWFGEVHPRMLQGFVAFLVGVALAYALSWARSEVRRRVEEAARDGELESWIDDVPTFDVDVPEFFRSDPAGIRRRRDYR